MTEPRKKTVAVIGASTDRSKFGNKCVRAYLAQGWDVYPINPKAGEIEGLRAYRSLAEVPAKLDRVSLYLPPTTAVAVLPQIAAADPEEFFVNPGAESDELVTEACRLGLRPIIACSILNIGVNPADYSG
jgi:uncharacterized protein